MGVRKIQMTMGETIKVSIYDKKKHETKGYEIKTGIDGTVIITSVKGG